MRSWPIWNEVLACVYKSDKSYGIKATGEVTVKVGTSASNSHIFLRHTTTHRMLDNGDREYRFYLDGEVIRRAVLKKGATAIEYITD